MIGTFERLQGSVGRQQWASEDFATFRDNYQITQEKIGYFSTATSASRGN